MNLDDLFQLLRPQKATAIERERILREEMESWEQRAFSLNAAIGLLRASLQMAQEQEQSLLLERDAVQTSSSQQSISLALSEVLLEKARHQQHLHTYTLRSLYQLLMEQKKQILQQGQERLLPAIEALPQERKERMHRLFQQSLEGIQNVSVARQENTAKRELEEQLQRPLETHTQTTQMPYAQMTFDALHEHFHHLLMFPSTSQAAPEHDVLAAEPSTKGAND